MMAGTYHAVRSIWDLRTGSAFTLTPAPSLTGEWEQARTPARERLVPP